MLEQILVWREGFWHGQCSGADGRMEQVCKWDVGVSGLLDRVAGASFSPRGLGVTAGPDGCGGDGSDG